MLCFFLNREHSPWNQHMFHIPESNCNHKSVIVMESEVWRVWYEKPGDPGSSHPRSLYFFTPPTTYWNCGLEHTLKPFTPNIYKGQGVIPHPWNCREGIRLGGRLRSLPFLRMCDTIKAHKYLLRDSQLAWSLIFSERSLPKWSTWFSWKIHVLGFSLALALESLCLPVCPPLLSPACLEPQQVTLRDGL